MYSIGIKHNDIDTRRYLSASRLGQNVTIFAGTSNAGLNELRLLTAVPLNIRECDGRNIQN